MVECEKSSRESDNQNLKGNMAMDALNITIFHNLGSLLLGISAWTLAFFAIINKKTSISRCFSIGSFTACTFSLILQLCEVSNRVNVSDFSAIADTIRAVILGSCCMVGITIILNVVVLLRKEIKSQIKENRQNIGDIK